MVYLIDKSTNEVIMFGYTNFTTYEEWDPEKYYIVETETFIDPYPPEEDNQYWVYNPTTQQFELMTREEGSS